MQNYLLGPFALSAFSVILMLVIITIRHVQFERGCGGRLKRAADASTVAIAIKELGAGLQYLKDHKLTRGYTSVLYNTPDEDIGHWYRNLRAALRELQALPPTTTAMEQNTLLLKLRGTLLQHGHEGGDEIAKPTGIAMYPHNGLFGFTFYLNLILFFLFGIGAVFPR